MAGHLRPVWPKQSNAADDTEIDLVLIPGPGSPRVRGWAVCYSPEKTTVGGTRQDTTNKTFQSYQLDYHVFESSIVLDDTFTWSKFLDQGVGLLEELSKLQQKRQKRKSRPIVFMCHSLGGFILKHALVLAKNDIDRYASLIKAIVAVVFLGCPHGSSMASPLAESAVRIIQSAGLEGKKVVAALQANSSQLVDLSQRFSEVALSIIIVSVYEEKETTMEAQRAFGKPQRYIFVNKRLATVGHEGSERVLGLANSHWELPTLADVSGNLDIDLVGYVKLIVYEAQEKIRDLSEPNRSGTEYEPLGLEAIATVPPAPPPGSHAAASNKTMDKLPAIDPYADNFALLPIIRKFATPRLQADLPCFMVETKLRNRDFCDRTEVLERLDAALIPTSNNEPLKERHAVIYGMAGLGKSEVAIQWVFTRRKHFNAVFWIQADNESKLKQDFSRIAPSLGLERPDKYPPDPVVSREIAKAWLADPVLDLTARETGRDVKRVVWLVIFDNADDPHLLDQFWPIFQGGSILVTSRDPIARGSLSETQINIDLQPFSEDEGALALRHLARMQAETTEGRARDDYMSREVTKQLGGWPLAIGQMAGIIRHEYMSLQEFYERYNDIQEQSDFHGRVEERAARETSRGSMASVIMDDFVSDESKVLLEVCSMLDPDCIQERIFTELGQELELLTHFPPDKKSYYRSRAELIQLSLIRVNDKREIWMHRVVQDTVRAKMSDDRFNDVFKGAVDLISKAWGRKGIEKRHVVRLWGNCAGLFPHVLRLQSLYESRRRHIGAFVKFAWLLNEAAWWQHELGNTNILSSMLTLARTICETLPLTVTFDLLSDIYHGLGGWANETNHGEDCLRYNSFYLQMRLDALDRGEAPSIRTAAAYNQKGTGWMMVKNYSAGKKDFQNSIDMYRSLPDYVTCNDSLPIVNKAVAHWLTGELDVAEALLTSGLSDRERRFGPDDNESFRTGRFLHTFGNLKFAQAMHEIEPGLQETLLQESETYHKRALAQYQSTIGTHHRTADVCHRVAEHCIRREDFESAELLIDQALKTWNVDPESFTPEIARTTYLKSKHASKTGDDDQAAKLELEAFLMRRKLLPDDKKQDHDLTEDDFNELVAFWSR